MPRGKPILTERQKRAYVEAGGTRCPSCLHPDVHGEGVEIDAGEATQGCSCPECQFEWTDHYRLVGISVKESKEDGDVEKSG